jgi:hypothetical protein
LWYNLTKTHIHIETLVAAQATLLEAFLSVPDSVWHFIGWLAAATAGASILSLLWMGILNHLFIHHETLGSVEKRQPYLPTMRVIAGTLIATAALFFVALQFFADVTPFALFKDTEVIVAFALGGIAAGVLQLKHPKTRDPLFAFTIGTIIAFVLIGFTVTLLGKGTESNPFVMALGVLFLVILWRLLFGPWSSSVKAMVLGTFIAWVALHMVLKQSPEARTATLLAAAVAMVPAALWCWLFLEYHRQRKSITALMFFAGMLSTAPILFYDALVRKNVELQFFVVRLVPENFSRISSTFVSGDLLNVLDPQSTIIATLISFLIVGLIEEASKFWVLKASGKPFFESIDDVMQLAVICAIGFAFAENVLNPNYFIGFVRDYLIDPPTPLWWTFLGNVTGRAVLTTMVHIVSSGVMGYFLGRAIFAESTLGEEHRRGHVHVVAGLLQWLLRLPEKSMFRIQMILMGLVCATVIHGMFNFLVTLPEILPGRPQTIADLFGLGEDSLLQNISILLVPSLLYVVGGFWLFTELFYRRENMENRGHLVVTDTFVTESSIA